MCLFQETKGWWSSRLSITFLPPSRAPAVNRFTNNPSKWVFWLLFLAGQDLFYVLHTTALTEFLPHSLSFTVCLCGTCSCSLLCYRHQTALLYNQINFVFYPMESGKVEKDLQDLRDHQVQLLAACPLNLIMKCHICFMDTYFMGTPPLLQGFTML